MKAEAGDHNVWEMIWKWQRLHQIMAFLWHLLQQKLFTNVEQAKNGLTMNDLCPCYHMGTESTLHFFRDCTHTKKGYNIGALKMEELGSGLGLLEKKEIHIAWHQPHGNWVKVNVNDSVIIRERKVVVKEWLGGSLWVLVRVLFLLPSSGVFFLEVNCSNDWLVNFACGEVYFHSPLQRLGLILRADLEASQALNAGNRTSPPASVAHPSFLLTSA
ncbi:hypothetical protein Ancab_038939 [Ancistrocladus abbreviatus]